MAYVSRRKEMFTPEQYRQRPRDYDPGLCDQILDRVSNGDTLLDICADDRDMPLPGTFIRWMNEEKELAERYEAAQRIGVDITFDEALNEAFSVDPIVGRLRYNALLTRAERLQPEKYGPRATTRVTTPEDDKAGIDHGAELRRRIDAMADRLGTPKPGAEA